MSDLCSSCEFDDHCEDPDDPAITIERLWSKVEQLRHDRDKLHKQVQEYKSITSAQAKEVFAKSNITEVAFKNICRDLELQKAIVREQTRILNQLTIDSKDFLEQLQVYHNKHGCNGKRACFCKNIRTTPPAGVPILQSAAPGYRIENNNPSTSSKKHSR